LPSTATVNTKGEPLFDPPTDVSPIESVRGSLVLIDWRWLRENDLFDAYATALGPSRGALLDVTAAAWVPFPLGLEHWRAIDALALSPEVEHAVGKFMGEHVHNVVLATLVRLAGHLGVTPWAALAQCHKLWLRSWKGGGMAAYRTGTRSARVEILNAQVVQTRSFRNGVPGTITAGIAPFCRRSIVSEIVKSRTTSSMALSVSWES
jgi:hypothetical protein